MSYVASASAVGNVTSLDIVIPASASVGDVAWIAWAAVDTETLTNPSGWVQADDGLNGNLHYRRLVREIQSGDPGSTVSLVANSANKMTALLVVDDDTDAAAPESPETPAEVSVNVSGTVRTNPTAALTGDRTVYAFVLSRGNSNLTDWSIPAPWTVVQEAFNTSSGETNGALAWRTASAGSVGGDDWTSDIADLRGTTMLVVPEPGVLPPSATPERIQLHEVNSGVPSYITLYEIVSGVPVLVDVYAGTDVSGGPTVHPLSGTVAAISTLAGAPTALHPLSGAITITSSLSGDITVTVGGVTYQLSGTTPVVSSTAGAIGRLTGLSGTTPVVSGLAGIIARRAALSGVTAVVSGLAGAPTAKHPLSGVIPVTSGLSGALVSRRVLSGTTAAVSGLSGAISVSKLLSGTIATSSNTAGTIALRAGLSGTIDALSDTHGAIGAEFSLSGLIEATIGMSGAITITGEPSDDAVRLAADVVARMLRPRKRRLPSDPNRPGPHAPRYSKVELYGR